MKNGKSISTLFLSLQIESALKGILKRINTSISDKLVTSTITPVGFTKASQNDFIVTVAFIMYGPNGHPRQWQPLQEIYYRGSSGQPELSSIRYPTPHPAAYGSYTQSPTCFDPIFTCLLRVIFEVKGTMEVSLFIDLCDNEA
ncbi:hypothetical protein RRG08_048303 [Elysia crispata]|uniref:Uncharacterized protein n=1 Tax=Elysia crispata TaxID=231223 RepID=A0AAE1DMQ6_9GAST|nr:hypothetical protein RRG08_048303 [Elysia crispata]